MADDSEEGGPPSVLNFDYLKSNLYRVIHADGVVGGVTLKGALTMSFWNERSPIPKRVTHLVNVDPETKHGTLGEELPEKRVVRDAIVREVDVSVVMDYRTAVFFREWLDAHIARMKVVDELRAKDDHTT
jgi:hypothetical protein